MILGVQFFVLGLDEFSSFLHMVLTDDNRHQIPLLRFNSKMLHMVKSSIRSPTCGAEFLGLTSTVS